MDRWILAFLAGHIMALFSPVLLPINLLLGILFLTLFFRLLSKLFLKSTFASHYCASVSSGAFIYPSIIKFINGFVVGAVYVMFISNLHFVNNFVANGNQIFSIKGKVSSVVVQKQQRHSVTMSIKVDEIDGIPIIKKWYLPATHIRVNWFKPSVNLQQGDELLATIKLSKPHGYQNTFGFDYNQWLFAKRFIATGNIKVLHSTLNQSTLNHSTGSYPQKQVQQLTTDKLIDATAGLKHQGIILAVGLGNRSLITSKQFELYNHMGISHLLAISGLHIGIIFLVMKLLLTWLTNLLRIYISYAWLQTLVLLLLWAYIALISFPISATRAALFVSLWVFLNINFSNINKVKLLLVVAFFSLLIDPFSVLTAAWWLTFSAVLGIILFIQKYPLLKITKALNSSDGPDDDNRDDNNDEKRDDTLRSNKLMGRVFSRAKPVIKNVILKITYLVKFQLFITIWMMPVVIFWFGGVSLSGVLTNLIAIPLFSFLLVPCIFLGTLFVILSDTVTSLSSFIYLLTLANEILTHLIGLFSHYQVFHFWVNIANSLWFYVLLLILLVLVSPVYILSNNQRLIKFKLLVMLPIVFLFIPILLSQLCWQNIHKEGNKQQTTREGAVFTKLLQPRLTMYVLDVGQGTSIVFQQGSSGFIYDLGPIYPSGFNATQAVVKPMLVGLGITDVDHIIISHNDSDHIGNIDVLGDDEWVESRLLNCPQPSFTWLNTQVEILWPPLLTSTSTSTSTSSSTPNVPTTRSASAPNGINSISKLSKNDSSCVVKITDDFSGISILLTGDITSKIERRLLIMAQNKIINLKSDILISAHHGSKYSSAMKFINAVAPVKVLHSAGVNNRFGFPTKEVMARFEYFNNKPFNNQKRINEQYLIDEKYLLNKQVQQFSTNKVGMIKVVFDNAIVSDNNDVMVIGYLNHWQPFWKKQNPFRFTSEMR